ncbi:MAG: phosphatidate cytidylyltransferase, partial [Bacilli bacterium]|nr:phosphatidate cytidylyltransferase [Bacilli bacterium]
MTKRIISAIVAILIVVPVIFLGGKLYIFAVYLLSLMSLHEIIKMKDSYKKVPILIRILLFALISFLVLNNIYSKNIILSLDYSYVAALLLTTLLPTIIYHNKDIYSIDDAFFWCGMVFFLGTSFNLLMIIRNIDITLLFYLILITTTTDTFAFFTGYFIGQNKLLPTISPKKTWEGFIGGLLAGTITGVLF